MVTRSRSGMTLLEVAVSAVVLGAVLTTVAQVIQWSAAEHRAAQRKRCALEAATTVLDRFTVRGWSAITAENAAAIRLPAEAGRFLVDPRLFVTVAEEKEQIGPPGRRSQAGSLPHKQQAGSLPHKQQAGSLSDDVRAEGNGSPPAKRISVEVTWAHCAGGQNEHVRLATWVFRRGPVKGMDK